MSQPNEISQTKKRLRTQLSKLRREQQDKDKLSAKLFERLTDLSEFSDTATTLYYVDVRNEVRTKPFLEEQLNSSLKVVVPYCDEGSLSLVELRDFTELAEGAYGILEPIEQLKYDQNRAVHPSSIDIALIPGLGFDTAGGRLGHGKGYYDRLLPMLREDCLRIGIAFDCQLVESIPLDAHDQQMDIILTPSQIIDCRTS
ncbi:MAG: 5-formyltetrahydrofolate cyclo-ligase [Planctomicrobium sp.]|nr:5-formyltetrahydrofolate cyclo-ligase [Planctomicrobium sp.]